MASSKSPNKSRKLQGVAVNPAMRGRGPKKGAPNAGRPRKEWIARLQGLASMDAVLDEVEDALKAGRKDPFFKDALHYVTDHGYGRATQPIELSGEVSIAENLNAARARALNRDTD